MLNVASCSVWICSVAGRRTRSPGVVVAPGGLIPGGGPKILPQSTISRAGNYQPHPAALIRLTGLSRGE